MRRFLMFGFLLSVSPMRADEGIPPEILAEIKAATVFVKVRSGPVSATGSGFLMEAEKETGLIVTNEHVVVPPKNLKLPPVTVQVVFHSGRKNEMVVNAEVVAADPDRDLAILRVRNVKDLPKPLDLGVQLKIYETMPLYILGFPFGQALATSKGSPAITIAKGSVSSLRENDFGQIALVQIDGDINPGNSGGPVVDTKGRLIGVSVAKVRGTNIGLAIPGRELQELLNGRISGLNLRTVKVENGVAEIEVVMRFIDPLNRIAKASLRYAPSDSVKTEVKLDKNGKFPPLTGAQSVDLTLDGQQKATGRFTVRSDSKAPVFYVIQPVYTKGDNSVVNVALGRHRVDFGGGTPKVEPKGVGGTTAGEPKVTLLKIGSEPGPASMCWSNDMNSFYHLDGSGVVRRLSYPALKEEASLDLGKKGTWISLSSHGLVVTVAETQELWLLDAKSLKRIKSIEIPGLKRAVSAPNLAYVYAIDSNKTSGTLSVIDLKDSKALKQYSSRDFKGVGLEHAVITRDGKYLFTTGWELLHRFRISGETVELEESSNRIIQGRFTGISVSENSDFVCAPSGGGNYAINGVPRVPYSTHVYSVANLAKPAKVIQSGAYPTAVGFDASSGLIYAHNYRKDLIIFDTNGAKISEHQFELNSPRTETRQFLVHPIGNKFLILGSAVQNKEGSRIWSVEVDPKTRSAQPKNSVVSPVDPKTPIKGVPQGWKEAAPRFCTYTAMFPPNGTLKESETSIFNPKFGQIRIFRAVFERQDGSVFITSQINLPPKFVSGTVQARYDLIRDLAIEEFKGRLVSDNRVEMAGMVGKEYLIETRNDVVRFRVIGPGVQIYRIVVVGTKTQVNSKDAEAFFDGFKRVNKANPDPQKK